MMRPQIEVDCLYRQAFGEWERGSARATARLIQGNRQVKLDCRALRGKYCLVPNCSSRLTPSIDVRGHFGMFDLATGLPDQSHI